MSSHYSIQTAKNIIFLHSQGSRRTTLTWKKRKNLLKNTSFSKKITFTFTNMSRNYKISRKYNILPKQHAIWLTFYPCNNKWYTTNGRKDVPFSRSVYSQFQPFRGYLHQFTAMSIHYRSVTAISQMFTAIDSDLLLFKKKLFSDISSQLQTCLVMSSQ